MKKLDRLLLRHPAFTKHILAFPLAIILLFSTFTACEEFLEEDIEGEIIVLRSPSQFAELDSVGVNFWWDVIEGATGYQFQLVSPSFDSARLFISDSIVFENRVFFSLDEGMYEWSVRALNGGYETQFSSSVFSIDTAVAPVPAVDISDFDVTINAPADEINLESGRILFWWDELTEATEYRLQIVQPSFENTQLLIYDTIISQNTFELDFTDLGQYEWRVRASNESSNTSYSLRSFQVQPRKSIELLSPRNGYKTNEINLPLQWEFTGFIDIYVIQLLGTEDFNFSSKEKIKVVSLGEASDTYQWFVSGINSSDGTSVSSDTLSFEYIAGPPSPPSNRLPVSGSEINTGQILLSWERSLDNILRDSIYILDTANQFIEGFPVGTINTQLQVSGLSPSLYRWTVVSLDNQGLLSAESDTLNFIIK